MVEFDSVKVKDQLGKPEDKQFTVNSKEETLVVEENATVIKTRDVTDDFIWGREKWSSDGTYKWKEAKDNENNLVTVRVVNPNNTFREHFRDDDFKDDSEVNTAYWDTANYRLAMDSSSVHSQVYNTTATTSSIFLNQTTISKARLVCTETKYGSDQIQYFLSADGGSNWEEVSSGVEHTFLNNGNDLRYKIVFIGNGASSTYIEDLKVIYS